MNLGAAIRIVRKEKGIKQKELAKLIGISTNALIAIEKNVTLPRKTTFNKIKVELNVSSSYIYVHAIDLNEIPEHNREVAGTILKLLKDMLRK